MRIAISIKAVAWFVQAVFCKLTICLRGLEEGTLVLGKILIGNFQGSVKLGGKIKIIKDKIIIS